MANGIVKFKHDKMPNCKAIYKTATNHRKILAFCCGLFIMLARYVLGKRRAV